MASRGCAAVVEPVPRTRSRGLPRDGRLAIDSAVLKQDSYFWEFYYGALAPGVHYVPFWTTSATDVLDVLANVSHPSSDARRKL